MIVSRVSRCASPARLPWSPERAKAWSLRTALFENGRSDKSGVAPVPDDEMSLTKLEELARMAHVSLPGEPAELERVRAEMGSIVRFTKGVKGAADKLRSRSDESAESAFSRSAEKVSDSILREDTVNEGGIPGTVLENAAKTCDGHFVVLKP